MAEHTHHDDSLNPHARGYQEDRIDLYSIALFTVGLIVVVVIVFVVVAVLMNRFTEAQQRIEDQRPALFALDDDGLYPGPRLQESPTRDMIEMRRQVNNHLDSYGWVDRQGGTVHIPIDRAMRLALDDGFSVRASDSGGSPE